MSLPPAEVIWACDRLASRLLEVAARHEFAAAIARTEWSGPHRDTFDERFAALQRELEDGRAWVSRVRREAESLLAELVAGR
jgi:hypothetical protein